MEMHVYEHPAKTGARRVVRQLLLWWISSSIAWFFFFLYNQAHQATHVRPDTAAYTANILVSLGLALPTAAVLWFLYRVIRFAIG
jgi:hypothetical protein